MRLEGEWGMRVGLAGWVLEVGAETADEAAGFCRGALGVQVHQPLQNLFVAKRRGPAVSGEHGGVQIVVKEPMARWQELFVILSLDNEQSLRVKSRVAWCTQVQGKRFFRIGIEFARPTSSLRAKIRGLLEQQVFESKLRRMRVTGRGGNSSN